MDVLGKFKINVKLVVVCEFLIYENFWLGKVIFVF